MSEPFHRGEIEIQELTGERGAAVLNGRLIAPAIPAGARGFLADQHFCVLGWAARDGEIWAAVLAGSPGFASADEAGRVLTLAIDGGSAILPRIPPFSGLCENDQLGVLFIEPATRRRLRVNGRVGRIEADRLTVEVAEAFPNCPKYIQRRELVPLDAPGSAGGVETGDGMTAEISAWVAAADTFFVASACPGGPVDASHRGGRPGFVVVDGGRLRIPDYPGNSMFGTLGNFAVNPRAGLVFPDFAANRMLQLTGDVSLDLRSREDIAKTGGTARWWEFAPRRWIVSPLNRAFRWTLLDSSPFNP